MSSTWNNTTTLMIDEKPYVSTSSIDTISESSLDGVSFSIGYGSKHGQSMLIACIKQDKLDLLPACLARFPTWIHKTDAFGNLPLHFAVMSSHALDMCHCLNDYQHDWNPMNDKGLTPFAVHLLTLKEDSVTVLNFLAKKGGQAMNSINGVNTLEYTIARGWKKVACFLMASGMDWTRGNTHGRPMCTTVPRAWRLTMIMHIPIPKKTKKTKKKILSNMEKGIVLHNCMNCEMSLTRTERKFFWRKKKLPTFSTCTHCARTLCTRCMDEKLKTCKTKMEVDHDGILCGLCTCVLWDVSEMKRKRRAFIQKQLGF